MPELYVGLMSGTSMDGIDAALVDFSREIPHLLGAKTYPWPKPLRERLMQAALGGALNADQFAALNVESGIVFAQAAQSIIAECQVSSDSVKAIGSHGQTLAHNPDAGIGYSLQIGCPHRIAELNRIPTVADFRGRDIAAHGQGAPLAPAFHQALFHHPDENRIILNIGGIANLTFLSADAQQLILGFDTGPGNCLMDAWAREQWNLAFDQDGFYARQGVVQKDLLESCLSDHYFVLSAPKSTGTDYFSPDWLQLKINSVHALSPQDVQATLLQLTAQSIAFAIQGSAFEANRVLVCGGGAHNGYLMQALSKLLACPVETTYAYGLHPDWVEAVAFAWLAKQRMQNEPISLSGVTGATDNRVLGVVYPA